MGWGSIVGGMNSNLTAPQLEPITVSVKEAMRLSGLSKATIFKKLAGGPLKRVKVGSSTLVTYASLKAMLRPVDEDEA